MDYKMNFHTHTTFCDGINTAEEMVQKAIEKGFAALGFSGHAYNPNSGEYCMSKEDTKHYLQEINSLKLKYKDKIKIYCGLEYDYNSEGDTSEFDYIIGSVHYVEKNGEFYALDSSEEHFKRALTAFDNDIFALTEAYFKTVSDVINKTKGQIVGHFDLVSKFNEGGAYFDEKHPKYVMQKEKAIENLLKSGAFFEINTGAMARGYKTVPYPGVDDMKRIAQGGGKFVLSSDCHNMEFLDYGFSQVLEMDCAKNIIDFSEVLG